MYISLVNWNSWQDCVRCVESLKEMNSADAEICIGVVDNDSKNNSYEELKAALPDIEILPLDTNEGYAAGHWENLQAARKTNSDYFWILNTDTVVDKDALKFLLQSSVQLGENIYGSVTVSENGSIDFAGAPANEQQLNYNNWKGKSIQEFQEHFPEFQEVQSVEGSSLFVPMSLVDKHGFMRRDFFMYGEETDYCLRLAKEGVKSIVVSHSIIQHANEGTTDSHEALKNIPKYYRRRNFLLVSREHFGLSRWEALGYKSSAWSNLKSVLKGVLGKKDESYYYGLACIHAFLGIRGKRIKPEKLLF